MISHFLLYKLLYKEIINYVDDSAPTGSCRGYQRYTRPDPSEKSQDPKPDPSMVRPRYPGSKPEFLRKKWTTHHFF
jgi:hypothetical protein